MDGDAAGVFSVDEVGRRYEAGVFGGCADPLHGVCYHGLVGVADKIARRERAVFLQDMRAVEIVGGRKSRNLFGFRCVVVLENHGIEREKLFCRCRLFFGMATRQPRAKSREMVIECGDCVALLHQMVRDDMHDEAIADALRRNYSDVFSFIRQKHKRDERRKKTVCCQS